MIVAGLQLDVAWEDPAENFRRAEGLAERAVAEGAQLLALPEMFNTGFSMNAARVAPHGVAAREFLGQLARRHQVWVLGGYADLGEPRPHNVCSVMTRSGEERARYHKVHPFSLAGEHEHYAGGESVETLDVDGVRVTPVICYDLRFPELFRVAAADTDLFVVVANWPAKRGHPWRTLLRARAMENQCFVLGVNRVGEGDGLEYGGDTALIDPLGDEVSVATDGVGVMLGKVDVARVAALRERFGFLQDRREDLYVRLRRV